MEVRFLHGERVETIRRAIAVSQLVPQTDETLVGYWLACYTRRGASGAAPPGTAQRKGRKKAGAPTAVAAAG